AATARKGRNGRAPESGVAAARLRSSVEGPVPERFVAPAPHAVPGPLIRLRLRIADRALVEAGTRVDVGQPLIERSRDSSMLEVRSQPALARLRAGDIVDASLFDADRGARGGPRPGDHARLLFHGPDGRIRLAIGRHP